MSLTNPRTPNFARLALPAALALALAGCMSASPSSFISPAAGPVASSDPLVLNSAPGPGSKPVAPRTVAVDSAPIPAAGGPVVVGPPPRLATGGAVVPATSPAETGPGFPNINIPPTEPEGKLLSPAERARMIAELEALRKRQAGPPAGGGGESAADLAKKAETHGADAVGTIEKCADPAVAATDPDCKVPTN